MWGNVKCGGRKYETTGARFTNDCLPAIQIRWTIRLAVIPLLAIKLQQILHMPRQHSCRAMYKIL